MIWVNIDKPTKRYVIHASRSCQYVVQKAETNYKGVDTLKRDGGWISFDSRANALARYGKQFSNFDLIDHC